MKSGKGREEKIEFGDEVSKVLAKERVSKEEVRKEYRGKLSERLRRARTRGGEGMNVNDMYDVFKGTMMEVADEVVGWRESWGEKKGNAWWTNEIKDAVEGKKKA